MTTTERLKCIGSQELKKRLGPNLIRGLIASVLIHSAVVSIALIEWSEKVPPVGKEEYSDTVKIVFPRPPDSKLPPVVHRPSKPVLPDILVHPKAVIDVSFEDTLPKLDTGKQPDLTGVVFGKDTGDAEGAASYQGSGIADSEVFAGFTYPWEIFVIHEVEPVPLSINPQPEYPNLARKAGVEAKIWVWVHVGIDGRVVDWNIIDVSAPGLGFEEAIADVIPRRRFTPALQNKNPVAVWVSIPFRFAIKQ
jgi:TonB family protein